ncbi:hypothetical protein [Paenibacillus sp. 481]|uniref:hypothetical protein n=1 Tax=Paenibacillus sp. 481 TaxID=2835869 RepID=UPI001E294CB6|nr:hypothetical protein [Paenibacillus sp. 481]UHA75562.1 hypothetical protein KIK04_11545 [Paenibacillus sp. 481]
MTNASVFNTPNNNVYTSWTNSLNSPAVITEPPYDASKSGNVYSAFVSNSASLGLLGGSVTASLRLNNGGTKTCYIIRVTGGIGVGLSLLSSLTASVNFFKNGTLTAPAAVTPVNSNLGSSNTSTMTVTSSTVAVTGGTTLISLPLGSGYFVTDFFGSIIVPPASTLSLSVSGSLSVAGLLSSQASLFWWEA